MLFPPRPESGSKVAAGRRCGAHPSLVGTAGGAPEHVNMGGEVDVAHFDIDTVTGASKLSFGLRWESLRELFCLLGGINSWVLKKEARCPHRHRPLNLQVTI